MNRPEAKYYEPNVDEFAFEHYVEDLEKYCNELEKALDKACKQLEISIHAITTTGRVWSCEEWKEWLLKDE